MKRIRVVAAIIKAVSEKGETIIFATQRGYGDLKVSDGTLWEGQIALYFRWTCLPDGAVPELAAGFSRNDRRLS